jgi:hypothetical protein
MGRDIRVLLNPGDLITREICTLSFGMAGQTMFLIGNAPEIDRNIGDDSGMPSLAKMMQRPIISPALVGNYQD